ncbi:hypothetical protein VDGL01_09384 [Verticillium dahliae]
MAEIQAMSSSHLDCFPSSWHHRVTLGDLLSSVWAGNDERQGPYHMWFVIVQSSTQKSALKMNGGPMVSPDPPHKPLIKAKGCTPPCIGNYGMRRNLQGGILESWEFLGGFGRRRQNVQPQRAAIFGPAGCLLQGPTRRRSEEAVMSVGDKAKAEASCGETQGANGPDLGYHLMATGNPEALK